jgi:hypothetical protein
VAENGAWNRGERVLLKGLYTENNGAENTSDLWQKQKYQIRIRSDWELGRKGRSGFGMNISDSDLTLKKYLTIN